jgi:methyltransferase
MVTAYYALLGLVAAERIFELRLAHRNSKRALAEGGIEAGASHFRWMQLLHASFLLCCALEASLFHRSFYPPLGIPMLALLLAAQALRYWAIATLGPRWNVRVIAQPGLPVVTNGPYRWVRHPNYLAVVLEGLAIPLIYSAWLTALVFSVLNAWLLRVRIAVEERTLVEHCAFDERLGDRPLIVPLRGAR